MKKIIPLVLSVAVPGLLLLAFVLVVHSRGSAQAAAQVGQADNGVEQVGPPWYQNWNYRRPVHVTSTAALSSYQVLVKLEDSNFDFSKARPDGGDIIFTLPDGVTTIPYWVESWSNHLAYLWVKVDPLAVGENTIYLYYGNQQATTKSNGVSTFNFFDDNWADFNGGTCSGIKWNCPDSNPSVASGIVILSETTGIISVDTFQYKAVGYKANFGTGLGQEWGGFINGASGARTIIRDLPSDVHNIYIQDWNSVNKEEIRLVPIGVVDWHDAFHIFEVRWKSGQSIADVDHGLSSVVSTNPSSIPTIPLPVTFYSFLGSSATLKVDWVYVREYSNPEPVATVGTQQALVELGLSQAHSPSPVYAGEGLTYVVTVTNSSDIDAPGVILTDTLPASVNLVSVLPSQGNCDNTIQCNLGMISAGSSASIAIHVNTSIGGDITNIAEVGSPSYELNFDNNILPYTIYVVPSADVSVSMVDSPDPVRKGGVLAYTITVLNHGPSIASGVVLTDSLSSELTFWSAGSEQGSCVHSDNNNLVSCDLLNLIVNVPVAVTIQVIPKSGGTFSNSVDVIAVETHDPLLSNNSDPESTFVDAFPPTASWILPVQDGNFYTTQGETITLKASAEDPDDQIAKVDFKYWDHLYDGNNDGIREGRYIVIGTVIRDPYQLQFNTSVLVRCEFYQVFAQAYDRAGNDARPRIFVKITPCFSFMPLVKK